MNKIYYEETSVTRLEPIKWVKGVKQVGLLNMLCIPHSTYQLATLSMCASHFIGFTVCEGGEVQLGTIPLQGVLRKLSQSTRGVQVISICLAPITDHISTMVTTKG